MRFAENLTEEIGTDDVASSDSSDDVTRDSEYDSSSDSADRGNLVTNSQDKENEEPELVTENLPVRASARLAGRKPLAQGRAC